jgi:hypothetical protein
MKSILLFLLALTAARAAEWQSSGLAWYWPETVPIAFVDSVHHTWTPEEKSECAAVITERFRSRTKRFTKQAIPGRESVGDVHVPGIGPVKWALVGQDEALIVVAVLTTTTGAPGEVLLRPTGRSLIRIRPDAVKDMVRICRHEGRHLIGETHAPH